MARRLILLVASLGGLAAFLYPFFHLAVSQSVSGYTAHSAESPLLTIGLVTLCLGAVLTTLGGRGVNSKMVAVLGVLVAANAVLRAVPGPAGFAAVFMLPVLCGYLYGATFGFLLGALSLRVSALIGAGVGPWLPYQMLGVGWGGLTSAGVRAALRPWHPERHPRWEVAVLGAWGLLWGFVFGALMNVWFWPYVFQPGQAGIYWQPGMGLGETLRHYAAFYAVTSFWWDRGAPAATPCSSGPLACPCCGCCAASNSVSTLRCTTPWSRWRANPAPRAAPHGAGADRSALPSPASRIGRRLRRARPIRRRRSPSSWPSAAPCESRRTRPRTRRCCRGTTIPPETIPTREFGAGECQNPHVIDVKGHPLPHPLDAQGIVGAAGPDGRRGHPARGDKSAVLAGHGVVAAGETRKAM